MFFRLAPLIEYCHIKPKVVELSPAQNTFRNKNPLHFHIKMSVINMEPENCFKVYVNVLIKLNNSK